MSHSGQDPLLKLLTEANKLFRSGVLYRRALINHQADWAVTGGIRHLDTLHFKNERNLKMWDETL